VPSFVAWPVLSLLPGRPTWIFPTAVLFGPTRSPACAHFRPPGRPSGADSASLTSKACRDAVSSTGDAGHQRRCVTAGLRLLRAPYGRSPRSNLDRGEILWHVAHGETPEQRERNRPALKGLDDPRTGNPAPSCAGDQTWSSWVDPLATTVRRPRPGSMLRSYDKTTEGIRRGLHARSNRRDSEATR